MDENTSPTTAEAGSEATSDAPDDPPELAGAPTADAVALLAELRGRVEQAAADIERLTDELEERTRTLDELESVADAILGAADTPVVVVGPDRRLRAVTRGASDLLGVEGPVIGKPLSTIVPDEVVEATREPLERLLDEPDLRVDAVAAGTWTVTVEGLGDGGAVLVLHRT
jgi:PAS domain-containing protein